MTTFYRPRGSQHPAILWDEVAGAPVYEFEKGMFTTDDPEIIALMLSMGFATEPIAPNVQAAMEINLDNSRPKPPPPPLFKNVPAAEPPPKQKKPGGA